MNIPKDVTVILLDSIGELASLYRCADGVFVGGSLVPSGGHNILEPAAFGKIPVFGPSMENFSEMAARFVSADAAVQVESPEDAGVAWIEFFREPGRMRAMGETARALVEDSRGATDALWRRSPSISTTPAQPRCARAMKISRPPRILLWPASLLYGLVVATRTTLYAKGLAETKAPQSRCHQRRKSHVGGTGKTPLVIWLAERLLQQGKRVAILTRGYRGTAGTSDEVELMKSRLQNRVTFGVGKNRFAEGTQH